jgi:hypothetical protein
LIFGLTACSSGGGDNYGLPDPIFTEAKLTASDGSEYDLFGRSVSVSGDYAVIGTAKDDYEGAAYIYEFNGTDWIETTKLTASDGSAGDEFGYSAAISGNRIVIGAAKNDYTGSAYIYEFNGTDWIETTKLTASDGSAGDIFGCSVSISDDRIIIGAAKDDYNGVYAGAAYIYEFNGRNWIETRLTAVDGSTDDLFGYSVSVSGDNAVIGAIKDDGKGSAYVFKWDGTDWKAMKLTASDGSAGDLFGRSVSVSGDYAVVGAYGAAYAYELFNGANWTETKLTARDGAAGDEFGYSVSVSGNVAVIGAYGAGAYIGAAYVYGFDGTAWKAMKLTARDGAAGDLFGYSVSVSGNAAVIGALRDDDKGADAGAAYVYQLPE